jgi:hypothetical protein
VIGTSYLRPQEIRLLVQTHSITHRYGWVALDRD